MKTKIKWLYYGSILLSIMLLACHAGPYKTTNKIYKKQAKRYARLLQQYPLSDSFATSDYFVGTTNFSLRRPNYVIIHHTAQNSCDETLRTFTLQRTQVSSHYVVCRTGTIFHMLNDYLRGHHAGISFWSGTTDLNSSSIGIEVDNNGTEEFNETQIDSLIGLLTTLKRAFNIPAAHFIGHADIAPGRKVDPSRKFPWQRLAEAGFGVWYDTTNITVPENFDAITGLRLVGYNVANPNLAIQSYKIHYLPQDTTIVLAETDRKIIFSLTKKIQ